MRDVVQGPGAAARSAGTAAENAQLDARLELAAKKAALRGLEAQANAPVQPGDLARIVTPVAPAVPLLPGERRTTIMVEKDGKTTILENPTAEQLRAVGIGSTEVRSWRPEWQQVAIVGSLVFGVIAVLYLLLAPRRRFLWTDDDPSTPAADTSALDRRMTRLENAIDTVAMEVERVSESQRYVSRLLSEGAAQPVAQGVPGERVAQMNGES